MKSPDGYNLGSLCAIDTSPREYNEGQLQILKSFASLVVDELELRRIAERDHLTGALTRRGFLEQLQKALTSYQRHGRPSALLLLDVDHFKSVNDRFGHPTGDEVHKAVSAACHSHLRTNDCFGRIGGEEFAVLLIETEAEGACAKAQDLRRIIQAVVVKTAAAPLSVTASFGMACLDEYVDTPDAWLSVADVALYRAKRMGRNRCVMHSREADPVAA